MLTERTILSLYKKGLIIKFCRYRLISSPSFLGEYAENDGDEQDQIIRIFTPNVSAKQCIITVFHELIHARDRLIRKKTFGFDDSNSPARPKSIRLLEKKVDNEAWETVKKKPLLFQFIVKLWGLKIPKKYHFLLKENK